jgi:predicted ATPase with chaperone activity
VAHTLTHHEFNSATQPLSMAMAAAKQRDLTGIVISSESAGEAAVVEEIDVIAVESLAQAIAFFAGQLDIDPTPSRLSLLFEEHSGYEDDFADVRGQEMAKRALTIAVKCSTHRVERLIQALIKAKRADQRAIHQLQIHSLLLPWSRTHNDCPRFLRHRQM